MPPVKHYICNKCRTNYEDYKKHLRSEEHSNKVKADINFNEIDQLIKELDMHLAEKRELEKRPKN